MTVPNFKTWSLETLYEGTKTPARKVLSPTHSFRIYVEGDWDKLNKVEFAQGRTTTRLAGWLEKRIIDLLGTGANENIDLDDALLYAAWLLKMDGVVAVMVGVAK